MLSAAGDILEEGVLEALSRRHWVNFQTSRTYLKSLRKDKELTKWSGMLSKPYVPLEMIGYATSLISLLPSCIVWCSSRWEVGCFAILLAEIFLLVHPWA
jgi:hypothetical protein